MAVPTNPIVINTPVVSGQITTGSYVYLCTGNPQLISSLVLTAPSGGGVTATVTYLQSIAGGVNVPIAPNAVSISAGNSFYLNDIILGVADSLEITVSGNCYIYFFVTRFNQ